MCKTGVNKIVVDETERYHRETSTCLDSGVKRDGRERLRELVWKFKITAQGNHLGKMVTKTRILISLCVSFPCTIPEVWIYSVMSR